EGTVARGVEVAGLAAAGLAAAREEVDWGAEETVAEETEEESEVVSVATEAGWAILSFPLR
ncbi:MAG: hypothetical protein ACKVI4_13565, partial [Actinomycetales bacterium]